jgi:2-hydroxycyclohexanecarboxyl-CoA dehydrogenase
VLPRVLLISSSKSLCLRGERRNSLTERVALVTGGGGGIGGAIALRLAEQGRAVAVADLLPDAASAVADQISARGWKGLAVSLDVTRPESVQTAFESVTSSLGPVDVLVNCAGWDVARPFVETDEEFWDRLIDINFKGVLRTTAAALPGMIERRWGRIVNISSDAARVGSSMESVYSGAKGAVISFTKTIAREGARAGVTANTVCPGPTDTRLLKEVFGDRAGAHKIAESMARAVPMKRIGQPDDIAPAVAYLASEDAGFVTGQTLSVSGGLTMA